MRRLADPSVPSSSQAFPRRPKVIFVILLSVSLLLLFKPQSTNAQAPQQFSFQGVARDGAGKIVTNGEIGYSFSIHQTSANGQVVYQNEGYTTTNSAGVFNLTIGTTANPLPSTIQWGTDKYFLQVGIDPDGAAGGGFIFTDLGTTQLISVPYALHSSESGKWGNDNAIVQKGDQSKLLPLLPTVGDGPTLIWYPKKGAFRAGWVYNNSWEEGGIGSYSFASGNGPKATGVHSISIGNFSQALAESAIALGDGSIANAMSAVAIGKNNTSSKDNSVSIGESNIASGGNAIAIGESNITSGDKSVSLGMFANATGLGAISIGHNISSAASYCTTFGFYNNNGDVPNGTNTDRLFQIGNGTIGNRSNALTILKNGYVGIGSNTATPEFILDIGGRARIKHTGGSTSGLYLDDSQGHADNFVGMAADNHIGFYLNSDWRFWVDESKAYVNGAVVNVSDRRLKKDLIPLDSSLPKLKTLQGYSYKWLDPKRDQSVQIGLMAQEVEQRFPELVTTQKNGYKAVNYIGLIPHLIEAVKELDKKTEEIAALKKELASVQEMNKKLSALEASVKELLVGKTATSTQTSK
jgi:hypothetical protein